MNFPAPVILASESPRRKEILKGMGFTFTILPAHIDESAFTAVNPIELVQQIAAAKGKIISQEYPNFITIAADTIVVLDEHILGKPVSKADARRMLTLLSGRSHQVITAFSITYPNENIEILNHTITDVTFRELSESDIQSYVNSGQPMDKAGAYGIQDIQYALVEKIDGCYFNVVGFPVSDFYKAWTIFL